MDTYRVLLCGCHVDYHVKQIVVACMRHRQAHEELMRLRQEIGKAYQVMPI